MKQYEIWWAQLPAPAGRRPVLLLSRDDAYTFLNKFIAAEITTTIRRIPIEVLLNAVDGLPKRCAVNCDNLRTIPKQFLTKRISRLTASRVGDVKRALGYALGWEELMEARQS